MSQNEQLMISQPLSTAELSSATLSAASCDEETHVNDALAHRLGLLGALRQLVERQMRCVAREAAHQIVHARAHVLVVD
jgi:hypothetical protein